MGTTISSIIPGSLATTQRMSTSQEGLAFGFELPVSRACRVQGPILHFERGYYP